ncbi:hypothetical protein AB0383_16830 [Amycolatopsis sp. NPDC051373]|uniref:hypothetical protein n=1 Tax=Amycolatopsis sp. NPDC051373 TaxID=3155801 RepID=UPI00344DEFAE
MAEEAAMKPSAVKKLTWSRKAAPADIRSVGVKYSKHDDLAASETSLLRPARPPHQRKPLRRACSSASAIASCTAGVGWNGVGS